jgi:hypothetical protein
MTTNKLQKKVPKTIYLSQEIWDYVTKMGAIVERKPSQEIEYIIKLIRDKREKDNLETIKRLDT